jgi:hypothetical protein
MFCVNFSAASLHFERFVCVRFVGDIHWQFAKLFATKTENLQTPFCHAVEKTAFNSSIVPPGGSIVPPGG